MFIQEDQVINKNDSWEWGNCTIITVLKNNRWKKPKKMLFYEL